MSADLVREGLATARRETLSRERTKRKITIALIGITDARQLAIKD